MSSIVCVSPPNREPVDVADLKMQERIDADITAEDGLLETFVVAAREAVERYTGRALITQTWRASRDAIELSGPGLPTPLSGITVPTWPYGTTTPYLTAVPIDLPRNPVQSITSVQYAQLNDTIGTVDLATLWLDLDSQPARVMPKVGAYWPLNLRTIKSLSVTFVAGYGDRPEDVPRSLRLAIQITAASWYANREGDVADDGLLPPAALRLLRPFRVVELS
jgi:uncharacterized phiE125 gp8 family phage protein